mgnify:FL=1
MTKEAVKESQMYGFKVCNIPHVICASPHYLSENKAPEELSDLAHHNTLLYKLYDQTHNAWELTKNGEKFRVKVQSKRWGYC